VNAAAIACPIVVDKEAGFRDEIDSLGWGLNVEDMGIEIVSWVLTPSIFKGVTYTSYVYYNP